MKRPSCSLAKFVLVVLALFATAVATATAADQTMDPIERFNLQNQAGIRLGVWNNLGSTPVTDTGNGTQTYQTDLKSSNFYFEAYFGYRLNSNLMLELAFGIVNRGDVTVDDGQGNQYFGNLLLYPIQLRAKVYPLASMRPKFQPYLMAGGGVYYGHNSIQFTTSSSFFTTDLGDSRTKLSYMVGGGVDWPLSSIVGLDLNVSYMPINFSKDLIFVRDYSALTVTFGIKYLIPLRKK
jgi:opacity protein-like surface antigen